MGMETGVRSSTSGTDHPTTSSRIQFGRRRTNHSRKKSQKDKNPFTKGTGSLRVKIDPSLNTGSDMTGTPNQ